ncbi:MAG: Flp pilus assembly protein CpaB [Armatimonadota bacterium]
MKQVPKTQILIAALCLGLVTAMLVYVFLSRQAKIAKSEVNVVTAKELIMEGTIIEPDMLTFRKVPKNILQPGTIVDPGICVGKVASRTLSSGGPVSVDALSRNDRLAYTVPPFMRAVTVAVDPVVGVGGFLKPGDHVDVIATFEINDGTLTKTVLQNVELIATGSKTISDNSKPKIAESGTTPSEIPNATLAVKPFDAEKLILADSKGKIRLALRRSDDHSIIASKGLTGRAMLGNVPTDIPVKEEKPVQTAADTSTGASHALSELTSLLNKLLAKTIPAAPPSKVKPAVNKEIPQAADYPKYRKVQLIKGTETQEVMISE